MTKVKRATVKALGQGESLLYVAEEVGTGPGPGLICAHPDLAQAWATLERMLGCDIVPANAETEALLGIGDG